MLPQDLRFLSDFVRDRAGVVLDEGQPHRLESRLAVLLRESELLDVAALCAVLRSPGAVGIKARVIEALTPSETSFFRDGAPFDLLRDEVLPDLVRRRQLARRLRIWSAACSSGQEPYSLAILLRDSFPELAGWDVTITATDISQQMVDRTNEGLFSEYELGRGMPASLRARHFERDGTVWRARPELRSLVEARPLNLIQPFPPDFKFDLVLIRNVLIYFDEPTQEGILRRVHRSLEPDGFMLLGTAETPRGTAFERAEAGRSNLFRPAA